MASRGKHQTVKHTERNWSRVSRETNGVEGSLASLQLPRCGREFINEGEKIKVDTAEGVYLSRA